MKAYFVVFALTIALVASFGMTPVFGQVSSISVTTDKTSYQDGDIIVVSGQVRDLLSGTPISMIVKAPNGNLVSIAQVNVNGDRTYSTQITAGGSLMKESGSYSITVQYGNESRSAETSFEFGGSINPSKESSGIKSAITDKTVTIEGIDDVIGYEIIGGKLLGITPDVDAKSLVIAIDATDDGQITLVIPRSILDSKMNGEDDSFFVLVDGEEVDFEEKSTSSDRTVIVKFRAGAEEIEIIGTYVIPEFGAIAAMILAVAIISIIAVSARSKLSIMPRY
jgi:predicted secreted protein with PEFG-CTERM motif